MGGVCSLGEAIVAANEDSTAGGDCAPGEGLDIIRLTSGVILSAVDNYLDGPNGLPSVTTTITVEGNGNSILRNVAEAFRIFHVSENGDLTLDDVTVALGSATNGGGIFNRGILTVRDSRIWGNTAQYGGGIFSRGIARVQRSEIDSNVASGWRATGGGISSEALGGSDTQLEIRSSTIRGNTVSSSPGAGDALGGGVYSDGGSLVISASTFEANRVEGYDATAGGGFA